MQRLFWSCGRHIQTNRFAIWCTLVVTLRCGTYYELQDIAFKKRKKNHTITKCTQVIHDTPFTENRIKNAVYHHRLFKLLPIDKRRPPLFGVLALAADLDCAQRRGK